MDDNISTNQLERRRLGKAPIRKPRVSKHWDEDALVSSIMSHQFETIVKIANFGKTDKDCLSHSLTNATTASHLIDESVDLQMYDNIQNVAWRIRFDSDVRVRTAKLPRNPWELVEGHVTVNASISQILSVLADDSKRKAYDKMFESYTDHKRVGEGTSLTSGRLTTLFYNGIWPVSGRKFIVLSAWKPHWNERDKTLGLIFATRSIRSSSVEDQEVSSHVRAKIYIAGFYISPHPNKNDINRTSAAVSDVCDVTMVSHIDFGGVIPAKIINYVQTHVMPDILRTIRDLSPLASGDNTLYEDAVEEYASRTSKNDKVNNLKDGETKEGDIIERQAVNGDNGFSATRGDDDITGVMEKDQEEDDDVFYDAE